MKIMHGSKLIIVITIASLFSSCFQENSSTQKESEAKDEAGCGVVDDRDLTEMSYPDPPDIFKARCAACHYYAKNATGPPLKGFMQKAPSEEWFKKFIRNQDDLIKAGDSLAIAIQEHRISKGMHYHNITDAELEDLMEYLQ